MVGVCSAIWPCCALWAAKVSLLERLGGAFSAFGGRAGGTHHQNLRLPGTTDPHQIKWSISSQTSSASLFLIHCGIRQAIGCPLCCGPSPSLCRCPIIMTDHSLKLLHSKLMSCCGLPSAVRSSAVRCAESLAIHATHHRRLANRDSHVAHHRGPVRNTVGTRSFHCTEAFIYSPE